MDIIPCFGTDVRKTFTMVTWEKHFFIISRSCILNFKQTIYRVQRDIDLLDIDLVKLWQATKFVDRSCMCACSAPVGISSTSCCCCCKS